MGEVCLIPATASMAITTFAPIDLATSAGEEVAWSPMGTGMQSPRWEHGWGDGSELGEAGVEPGLGAEPAREALRVGGWG